MEQSWRWFGPDDAVPLSTARQAGAVGVVTSLHQIPYGVVWSVEEIEKRKAMIAAEPSHRLHWNVVESLPVHERIKLGDGDLTELFDNYRASMRNLAACGVKNICYNFMPVVDWTRTELAHPLADGSRALRFNAHEYAAFDCFMLKRPGAEADFPPDVVARAKRVVRQGVGKRQGEAPCQHHGRHARRLRPLRHPGAPRDARPLQGHHARRAAPAPGPLPPRGDPAGRGSSAWSSACIPTIRHAR